jgi:hypothetical protein
MRRSWKAASVVLAALVVVGCWPRISRERLPDHLSPTSLFEAYPYAQDKASEWSPNALLEGASAGYKRQEDTWEPNRFTYVFVDTEQQEYLMIVMNLDTGVVQTHPSHPIEGSMVSTFQFFLEHNPLDEQAALEIADNALGNQVALSCKNPELAVRGHGFGERQYWAITYTAYEPTWRVVGELSVDGITGEVVSPRDLTDRCGE